MKSVLLLLGAGLLCAADQPAKKVKLPTGRDDLARGQQLFQGHCALCHGSTGEGGRGPLLAQRRLRRATDDAALVKVIEEGIPGTEMPGAWQMTEREHRQVGAYVRSLGRVAQKPVPGDPARGLSVYQGKGGCPACHVVSGAGGAMGPELSNIGARRSAAYLREAIVSPEAALPDDFLQVRAVRPDGVTVTGARLNEDSFTIQLRDYSGNLHAYWKHEVKELLKDRGKSPMPSYQGKLSEDELTDLVAYLASLREEK